MKAKSECYACLKRLTLKTLTLSLAKASLPEKYRKRIKKCVLEALDNQFNINQVPAALFTAINRKIKTLTQESNPFSSHKEKEISAAKQVTALLFKNTTPSLETLLHFCALGNSFDFFKNPLRVKKELREKTSFSVNHASKLKVRLKTAKRILFFADNAGESFFDLPFVDFLAKKAVIFYVVKHTPVQNDLTIDDLRQLTLLKKFPKVITTGNDAVGMEINTVSKTLRKELARCDLIIAKGMGYYETFSELPQFNHKIFHLLMAKCPPVAESLGVKVNSYVFRGY